MSRPRFGQDKWEPGRHKAKMEHAQAVNRNHEPGPQPGRNNQAQQRSNQAVVKVIGWSKGGGAAARQANYIGRHSDKEAEKGREAVPLYNEMGQELRTKDEVQREMQSWGLKQAQDNRSKAWKDATPEQRAQMSESDALAKRQSVHMILSLPAPATKDQARESAEAVLNRHFGAAGYRYVYAVHTDHGRPHIHAIIKTTPETGHAKQLRLGPQELDYIRQDFAREARSRGLDVQADRRLERPGLAQDIAQGREPLKATWTKRDLRSGSDLAPPQPAPPKGVFERIAQPFKKPDSFAPTKDPKTDPAGHQRQQEAIARLRREFAAAYVNPTAAEAAFKRAHDAAPKRALWVAANKPELYGARKHNAPAPAISGRGLPRKDDRTQPPPVDTPAARAAAAARANARQLTQTANDPHRVIRAASRVARDLERGGGSAGQRAAQAVRASVVSQRPETPGSAQKQRDRTQRPGRGKGSDIDR